MTEETSDPHGADAVINGHMASDLQTDVVDTVLPQAPITTNDS